MRRIARRLDRNRPPRRLGRKLTGGNEIVEHSIEKRGVTGMNGHAAPLAKRRAPRHPRARDRAAPRRFGVCRTAPASA